MSNLIAQTSQKDKFKTLLQEQRHDTSRVLLLADLSFEYLESKPDTTMLLALEALTLARRIGFEKGEAVSLNRIGNAYDILGNYPGAMAAFLQALALNEKINNPDGIRRNYNNIGVSYFRQEDYRQALFYHYKAKDLSEKHYLKATDSAEKYETKKALSVTLNNIGETYYRLKIYDSAKIFTEQSSAVAEQINYPRILGSSLIVLGEIHYEKGQNTLALEYFRLSIPYLEKAENYVRLSEAFMAIAKVFEKDKQSDSVLFYAKWSLLKAKETGFTRQVRDAGRFLTSYYRTIKNPDSAFFYLDITKIANDSLFSLEKSRQLQSLAFDEKLRQVDIAAAELKDMKKRNHNLQYAAIALGLLTFIILFLLLSHSVIANQKLIRFLGVIALLIVFEFINLFIHPYLSHATNDSPLIMLLVMVCIAALLVPLHHRMEKWISHRLVEKNKKIRLEAAKKTIAKLEPASAKASADNGEQTN